MRQCMCFRQRCNIDCDIQSLFCQVKDRRSVLTIIKQNDGGRKMREERLFESTGKVTKASLDLRKAMIERSKQLRNPSPKVNKIGSTIGVVAGVILLIIGIVHVMTGNLLWALGAGTAGVTTVVSNAINYKRRR